MKGNVYWWIEKADGQLVETDRYISGGVILDFGKNITLCEKRRYAKQFCRLGERPVKVRIEKVR